jgi:hypothetical protein
MQIVKKTDDYRILKRRDNRYAVKTVAGNPVNGEEKVAILRSEGLIKTPEPKAEPEPEPAAEEEAVAEEPAGEEQAGEAPEENKE